MAKHEDERQEQIDAAAEEQADHTSLEARFNHLGRSGVLRLWEAGVSEKGRPLSRFEAQALLERWVGVFRRLPPSSDEGRPSAPAPTVPTPQPQLAENDLMSRADVARKLSASVRTIQRMEDDGRLPKPLKVGPRQRRHRAKDVNALIEQLEQERHIQHHGGRGTLH